VLADPTLRLAVAYGLIAILVLAAILCAVLLARNSPHRRIQRDRARDAKRTRLRHQARTAATPTLTTSDPTQHQIAVGSEK
jgi:hypothetical protein